MNYLKKNARFGLLCVLFLAQNPLFAQKEYAITNIPPNLMTNAQAVVRRDEMTVEVSDEDELVTTSIYAVTIFNKEAESLATHSVGESANQKTKYLEGRVFDADAVVVRESKKSDIQDIGSFSYAEYQDSRTKYLDLRYGQYPYTVEFKTKQTSKRGFNIPDFYIEYLGRSVQHAAVILIAPKNYDFHWKGIGTDVQPSIQTDGNNKTWQWTFDNLAAKPKETFTPFQWNLLSKLVIAPNKVTFGGIAGSFADWNAMGHLFYDLNKDRDQLSAYMKNRVRIMTQGLTNKREKIAVLYRHLQENYRYVSIQIGIGGWQTFDAQFVEQKKYGDCKALSNYMKAMLAAADIPAYHTLVYAGEGGGVELYDDAPSPDFNHMILYVPSEDMWLECTSNDHTPGYLGDFTADRQVLILTPEGGKLSRTPALHAADNLESHATHIVIAADGNAEIKASMRNTCERQDYLRALVSEKKQAEIEKAFAQYLGFSITNIKTLDIQPDKSRPDTRVEYCVNTPAFATRSGKRMFVPLLKTHAFQRTLPATKERISDLKITTTYTFRDTVTLQLPTGYSIENLPANKQMDNEFGAYNLQIEKSADQLRVMRSLEIKPVAVPAARYNEVRQFYLDVMKLDGGQAVLVGG